MGPGAFVSTSSIRTDSTDKPGSKLLLAFVSWDPSQVRLDLDLEVLEPWAVL